MKIFAIVLVTFTLSACGTTVQRAGLIEAQKALNNGDFKKALKNTEIAEAFGTLTPENKAKLHFQRAMAQEGLDMHAKAIDNYRYVVNEHANSAYTDPAQRRLEVLLNNQDNLK